MLQSYTIEKFYGGNSEDDALIQDAEVLYSENMDLTTSSLFITNSPVLTSEGWTLTEERRGSYTYEDNYIICDDNSNIYMNGDLKSSSYKVVSFWNNSEWLYMLGVSGVIYRISLGNLDNASWTADIEIKDTITTSGNNIYTIVNEDNTYIGGGFNISEIDNATGTFTSANLFEVGSPVKGMERGGSVMKVFLEDGTLILWDGTSTGNVERKDLGIIINYTIEVGNTIYISARDGFYQLNGYDVDSIKYEVFSDALNSNKNNLYLFGGVKYKGVIYMPDSLPSNITGAGRTFGGSGITSLGINKKGFPTAMQPLINKDSSGNSIDTIYSIDITPYGEMYIAFKNSLGNHVVEKLSLASGGNSTNKEGLIILPTFSGYNGEKRNEKQLTSFEVIINFKSDEDNELTLVDVSRGELESLGVITNTDGAGIQKISFEGINRDFYNVTLGLINTQNGVKTREESVEIYCLTYIYDNNKKQH